MVMEGESCHVTSAVADIAHIVSPACESLCIFRLSDLEKALPHWVQAKSFSFVCVSMCLFNSMDVENALSHWVQANSFSPVWESLCVFS